MARGDLRSVTKLSEHFQTHDELIGQRAHNKKFSQRRIKTNEWEDFGQNQSGLYCFQVQPVYMLIFLSMKDIPKIPLE